MSQKTKKNSSFKMNVLIKVSSFFVNLQCVNVQPVVNKKLGRYEMCLLCLLLLRFYNNKIPVHYCKLLLSAKK